MITVTESQLAHLLSIIGEVESRISEADKFFNSDFFADSFSTQFKVMDWVLDVIGVRKETLTGDDRFSRDYWYDKDFDITHNGYDVKDYLALIQETIEHLDEVKSK